MHKNRTLFLLHSSCLFCITVLLLVTIILFLPGSSFASPVTIKWNPGDSDTDGYKIYYGTESENYTVWVDVGGQTSYTLTDLEPGTYYAAVTAYNSYGESDFSDEVTFTVGDDNYITPDESSFLETGEISIDHNWKRVDFKTTYSDPVVIAKPLSFNGCDPAVIRIRDVNSTGFEIRVQEWNYLDGWHTHETVGYTVVEAGSYILPDGTKVEAGHFETDKTDSFTTVSFAQAFNQTPVVIACITSFNDSDTVAGRIKNITTEGYQFCMQEQEANKQSHLTEKISYLAWEPSSGNLNNLRFEIGRTRDIMQNNFRTINFAEPFNQTPVFIADMQTCDGGDTASLRWENKDLYGVDVKVEEEQSRDNEVLHTTEVVGYMLFSIKN